MKILIIKTSSMGDIIHTLPAITDAKKALGSVTFDWVVEENFAEIPRWHPAVNKIIPMAWRRWRKNLFSTQTWREWREFYKNCRQTHYDLIIDAQGLLKSACFAYLAKGPRVGADHQSARESIAAFFYQHRYPIAPNQHAIFRIRSLFAQALGYKITTDIPDYGIDRQSLIVKTPSDSPYLVFLHGTTWDTKHWPPSYWRDLALLAHKNNYAIKLPWGNLAERERALHIAADCNTAEVLPRLRLAEIASVLAGAKAIVAVDTGLGHLAAALDIPTISLYGPTHPDLTGALGKSQIHLKTDFACAPCLSKECGYLKRQTSPQSSAIYPPCFTKLTPAFVWETLAPLLAQ